MQTNTPAVPSFESFNPIAWADFRKAFTLYVKHIGALEKGDAPNAAEGEVGATFTMEDMTYASSGLPLLPAAVKNEFGTETKKIQQAIIRVYLSKHYSNVSLPMVVK